MLILDRYRLGTIVSQRRMIFLATDSNSGRPVWVHVIAEPVDSARQEIVKHAKTFIQAGGGQDIEDFLEYGYHDKTHYVITASRPECKELGPYLDTLLALRGIAVPNAADTLESTASGALGEDRTQEITARLRRVADPARREPKLENSGAAATGARSAEPPPQDRTMSSQPTMYLRAGDVRQAMESGTAAEKAGGAPESRPGDPREIGENLDETETTLRFVRPKFADSGDEAASDPDQTAKVISPWSAKRAEGRARSQGTQPRPVVVPARPPDHSDARKYPVWREKARPAADMPPPPQSAPAPDTPEAPPQAKPVPYQNGSGGHRLVLPPVRRGSPPMAAPASPPVDADPVPREADRRASSDPKLLYMTLALVMVSLAAIALGLGWYIHTTANVAVPPGAAAVTAAPGGAGAEPTAAAQSSVPATSTPAQPASPQLGGASFSPLLLSIAFISAVLIFAAVVVLFMAVKRGT